MKCLARPRRLASTLAAALLIVGCSRVGFQDQASTLGSLGVCNGVSCELTPLTSRASVITILLAIGDQVDSQLVVGAASAQLIAETVVRYASPVARPKILVVIDSGAGGESAEDSKYVAEQLLTRYNATLMTEPTSGLTAAHLVGYDLVWFNNPGAPMGKASTRDVLKAFAGGVVLQGDDLSWGAGGFDNSSLTGLKYIDNGTAISCAGKTYPIDNNKSYQYRVKLDVNKIPGAAAGEINFVYGNDIDNTTVARPDLEILATARGPVDSCVDLRPAIVRYLK